MRRASSISLSSMARLVGIVYIDPCVTTIPSRHPPLPGDALELRLERLGVQDLGQDLKRFHDSWARAVEVLIAIGEKDSAVLDGSQFAPSRPFREPIHFLAGSGKVEAAGHAHD